MDEQGESFSLDYGPPEHNLQRVRATIERDRARTANRLAMTLVVALVVSLPLYVLVVLVWFRDDGGAVLTEVFDKWYAVVSPLAGVAVGAYYTSQAAERDTVSKR